jgi:aminoglycoside phosphotransferase (APT) family kinase protein
MADDTANVADSGGGETIAVREGEQLDIARVEAYLRAHIAGLGDGTLQVEQFPSGASNLTYLLRNGEWEAVLRRPPLGPVAPKAHDMERESGLLRLISPVFPLAPRPYVFCGDLAVIGAPFYVMERKHGVVVDRAFPAEVTPTEELCRRLSETVVDALVRIHGLDWRAAGLEAYGHPDGFLARQVNGWIERYRRAQTDDIPEAEPLMRWFVDRVPESPAPTLIHNDFKLNNMLLDRQTLTHVNGVLDWEMATVGDPLFDLAVTLSYWVTADDPALFRAGLPSVTHLPGFISRDQFKEKYAARSGRDLSSMTFYETFAYFKLAVIIQQIYVRWKRGQTQDARFASFNERVRLLILYATWRAESG